MKKILTICCSLVFLFSAVVFAIAVNAPAYSVEACTVEAGREFSFPVSIKNNSGIISLRLKIVYDENILELVKVEDTGLLAGYTTPSAVLASPYTLRWADSLAITDNISNGEVAVVTFRVKNNIDVESADIAIEHTEARTSNGTKVAFSGVSETVNIAKTHSFSNYISDGNATCTADGTKTAFCDYGCGTTDTVVDVNTAKGHEYNSTVVNPTCTEQGYETFTCSCSDTYTETIPALGHEYSSDYTVDNEATCIAEGSKSKHCTRSGCSAKTDVTKISRLAHSEVKIAGKAATCAKTGLTDGKKCSACGKITLAQQTIAKKSHSYDNACDTSCNVCKATRKVSHSYKNVTIKATLTKNGKVENKCSVCGYVSKTTTVYYPKTIKLSATSYTYNGKAKKPTVTVKDSKGNTLKKDTDYTVKYASGCKNPGKYTVTVTFKGKYTGSKKLTFTIKPAKVTLSKVTAGSKQLTVNWKTVSAVTGYEVVYSTSKKFTNKTTKTVTVKKAKAKKTTIKKLKKGKKYYVKVRAYKTVNGKKVYGAWSSVKNVKVK